LGQHAWYAANSNKKTHPVGRKMPNAWGLYDMHGNVAEWCNDYYAPDYYASSPTENPRGPADGQQNVLRGGHWSASAEACTAAFRIGEEPGFSDACFARDAIGFRCVRKAPAQRASEAEAQQPVSAKAYSGAPLSLAVLATMLGAESQQTKSKSTGLVYDNLYLRHLTGPGHPERPERLKAIVARFQDTGLMDALIRIQPRRAEEEWLTAVHTPEHIAALRQLYDEGERFAGSPDTPVSDSSYEAALLAVGGVLAAVDAVMASEVQNAFCAVRPPGHHATPDKSMGFCLLNNVAIAARYIQQKHQLPKVLIVDWDVHHGNGTQDVFYTDPSVFYFGIHQYPFYPGTGSADERGAGEGKGQTLNVPLTAGSGDAAFQKAFSQQLLPAARHFRPDFVLVSAGFDAHRDDPLGSMRVTAEGFARLTALVKQIADEHCHGRVVSVLEGGYDLEGLAASAAAHVRALMK
jgi:acetoin utilization deacetylase AcuC-like enzyme